MPKACIYANGFPAFVLSKGSSLALFVGRVIDANVIIQKNEKGKNDMKKCKLLFI